MDAGRYSYASGLSVAVFALMLASCATTGKDPYFTKVKSDANVFVAPMPAPVTKIAVMPFKAPTELIGSSVSDMIVTELLRAKRYTLVERSQMAHVLSETELALAGLSQSKAMEVAKMLGADGVVIGTVDEYGTQAQRGKTYAVVGVSIRLVNASNGQILWSANLAKIADNANVPISAHARAVVREIVAGLYQKWGVQRVAASASAAEHLSPNAPVIIRELPGGGSSLPEEAPAPAAPSGVTASDMGLRSVTLTWNPPTDSAYQIRIERSHSPKGPFSKIGETAASRGTYTDRSGLSDATTYYYRLFAVDRAGLVSVPSPVVESMTAPPPDPPQNLTAKASASREITVAWNTPRSPGIAMYRVERASGSAPSNWTTRSEIPSTQFVDGGKPGTDLQDSSWYLYRVIAINQVGVESAPSQPIKVKTLPPPAVVKDFAAVSNQVRCIPLSWAASSETDVTGYEIERRDSGDAPFAPLIKITSRTTTNFLDGKKDPGALLDAKRYEYRIRAFNRVGSYSEWTPPLAVTTRPPPPAPKSVAARSGQPRAADVFWSPSPDEKVVGYEVQRAEGEGALFVTAGRVEGRQESSFTDRAGGRPSEPTGRLKDGTTYRYRVRAFNTAGALSEWSEEATATTKPAPAAPIGLSTTEDRPKRVELAWTANPETDIAYYSVESRAADSGRWREAGRVQETSFVHSGLDDGEKRVYRIKAVDKDTLESAWSEEVPGSSRPLPHAPADLTAHWTETGVRLTWSAPTETITEYRIHRKGFLFSSEKIASTTGPSVDLGLDVIRKGITVFVTALDEEGLESKPSSPLELRPPL